MNIEIEEIKSRNGAKGRFLTAKIDGKKVGELSLFFHEKQRAFLSEVYVSSEFRQNGISKVLIAKLPELLCNIKELYISSYSSIVLRMIVEVLGVKPTEIRHHHSKIISYEEAINLIPLHMDVPNWYEIKNKSVSVMFDFNNCV